MLRLEKRNRSDYELGDPKPTALNSSFVQIQAFSVGTHLRSIGNRRAKRKTNFAFGIRLILRI